MIRLAVEKINKTYTFPLPGTKSRISVKYTRPQTHEGSISVVVSGWITIEDKKQFPFTGTLVKSFGTNFKDLGKDLTESLESANEKSGNPIKDAYDFIISKIVPSIPYDAMDDFFKGIKQRKQPKTKVKNDERRIPREINKQPKRFNKNQIVEIDLDDMQNQDNALYNKIIKQQEDIEDKPYAVIYEDNGKESRIIFQNKTNIIIPRKFLSLYTRKNPASELEQTFKNAYKYYMENREKNPSLIELALVQMIFDYKEKHNIPIDDIDNKLLENKKKEKQSQEEPKNWISKLFKK